MILEEVLDQAMAMLQRRGRLTYRTLKLHFQLDDAHLSPGTRLLYRPVALYRLWKEQPAVLLQPDLDPEEEFPPSPNSYRTYSRNLPLLWESPRRR
jgi:hypothetical protein